MSMKTETQKHFFSHKLVFKHQLLTFYYSDPESGETVVVVS